jgi:RHS repeat-associated protein
LLAALACGLFGAVTFSVLNKQAQPVVQEPVTTPTVTAKPTTIPLAAHGPLLASTGAPTQQSTQGESFSYDAAGNRLSHTKDGFTKDYTMGPGNRILSDGIHSYEWDDEGNMTTKTVIVTGEKTTFNFDHRNRLTDVKKFDPRGNVTLVISYVYDLFNRRIQKTVAGQTTTFNYLGDQVWSERRPDGSMVHYLSNGTDKLIARNVPGEGIQWYLTDRQGTVQAITDLAGELIHRYKYDAFGARADDSPQLEAAKDRYGFTARELDEETGLYYFRNRYYDPDIGRFITEDPIGFAAGDFNLSRYVANCPLSYIDPMGLSPSNERKIVGAVSRQGSQGVAKTAVKGADKIDDAIASLDKFLGPGARRVKPPGTSSDYFYRSADGLRQVRFDFTNSARPHVNVEVLKPLNRYPGDRAVDIVTNEHIYFLIP